MNDDTSESNGLTPSMLPGSLLPFKNDSLGTRLWEACKFLVLEWQLNEN